ncbi:MAG: MFS transporter [Actinomycetota bacterium]|nr:MFS transporter [Actinomycetota bacterium]
MLALATLGFALNFWAWALLSPLAVSFTAALQLTSFQQSLLVAVPVVVGSLGRIPVGALTDRFGGRIMFPVVSLVTVVPVLYLGLLGHSSLAALLVGGFFLGVAGTAFAVGVPFVGAWFPPERRGFAIGVFGAGMGGTAISALTTVNLVNAHTTSTPFVITAVVLVAYGVLAAVVLRDSPTRTIPTQSLGQRLRSAAALPLTWQASALYTVAFGGYVAFSVYLPTYLKNAYLLTPADAANRMAGFVVVAVLMRPVGGWLSDRVRPASVLAVAFAVVAVGALVQSATPALVPLGTLVFLAMAGALGAASGATFALVAQRAPASQVGSVTGIVGAAGGLGGFVPPLVMGSIFGRAGDYRPGLLALSAVAVAVLLLAGSMRRTLTPRLV